MRSGLRIASGHAVGRAQASLRLVDGVALSNNINDTDN
jgi:hypothetical protein